MNLSKNTGFVRRHHPDVDWITTRLLAASARWHGTAVYTYSLDYLSEILHRGLTVLMVKSWSCLKYHKGITDPPECVPHYWCIILGAREGSSAGASEMSHIFKLRWKHRGEKRCVSGPFFLINAQRNILLFKSRLFVRGSSLTRCSCHRSVVFSIDENEPQQFR